MCYQTKCVLKLVLNYETIPIMTEVKTQIKQRSKLKDKHDMWPNV